MTTVAVTAVAMASVVVMTTATVAVKVASTKARGPLPAPPGPAALSEAASRPAPSAFHAALATPGPVALAPEEAPDGTSLTGAGALSSFTAGFGPRAGRFGPINRRGARAACCGRRPRIDMPARGARLMSGARPMSGALLTSGVRLTSGAAPVHWRVVEVLREPRPKVRPLAAKLKRAAGRGA